MYPSISNDNQKHTPPMDPTTQSSQFGVSPPQPPPPPPLPTAPPLPNETSPSIATGIPISSTNQFFPSNGSTVFQRQAQGPVPWSTGLCQCSEDIGNCCVTCWCPCITFGEIAEIVDEGSPSCEISGALYTLILCLTGCSCLYSCFYRSKLRKRYWLEESPCPDCLVHCFCGHCALCQEYRELKNRGFDMSIGWKANLDKQNRGVIIPPVIAGGMNR